MGHSYDLRSRQIQKKKSSRKGKSKLSFAERKKWMKLLRDIADEDVDPKVIVTSSVGELDKKDATRDYLSLIHDSLPLSEKFRMNRVIRAKLREDACYLGLEKNIIDEEKRLISTDEYKKSSVNSVDDMKRQIITLNASESVKILLLKKLKQLVDFSGTESTMKTVEQLVLAINLPYGNSREIISSPVKSIDTRATDIERWCVEAKIMMDRELFGMDAVKNNLLTTATNYFTNPKAKSMMCLIGPPGIGKTAIFSSFAKILNLPFEHIPLGGMTDPGVIKGSSPVWIGSSPGIILESIRKHRSNNLILHFDEIDKISTGMSQFSHSIEHSLLHVTDYTQNNSFRDMFIPEITYDISDCWFLFSGNDASNMNTALKDRMDIIYLPGYTVPELKQIFERYVLPAAIKEVGISKLEFNDDAVDFIIHSSKNAKSSRTEYKQGEYGVRGLKKLVANIVKKINFIRLQPSKTRNATHPEWWIDNFDIEQKISLQTIKILVDKSEPTEHLSYFL
jgi:ATP-dependent Lon protease